MFFYIKKIKKQTSVQTSGSFSTWRTFQAFSRLSNNNISCELSLKGVKDTTSAIVIIHSDERQILITKPNHYCVMHRFCFVDEKLILNIT